MLSQGQGPEEDRKNGVWGVFFSTNLGFETGQV